MKKSILKLKKEIAYLITSIFIFLLSFYYIDNDYMHFISIITLSLSFYGFNNKYFEILINKFKNKFKYFWLYLSIRLLKIPLRFFIFGTTLLYLIEILENKILHVSQYLETSYTIYSYFIVSLLTWTSLRFSNRLKEYQFNKIKKELISIDDNEKILLNKYKTTTLDAIFKIVNFTILVISFLIVFQKLGFSLSGIVAFGGISGIVIGFASRDLLANLFGGIMVYFNRPFDIGDWISSPDREIEGTVEQIGWFITKIRKFNMRPIYIPNSVFTNISVENPSRMTHRRIKEEFRIKILDTQSVSDITKSVKNMLIEHNGIDENVTLMVNLDKIENRSLVLFIYCFTKTTNWENFHSIKQDVLIKTLGIIDEFNAKIPKDEMEIEFIRKNS